jgi:uncharacterized protein (TIGR00730 family)
VTHHNTLDTDLYLRIAPELYLKRLIAGGMPRVFEINRNFRNEGMSTRHNPEFTMLESYEAYADYHDVMELTEALVQRAAREAVGHARAHLPGPRRLAGRAVPRVPLLELVREATGRPDLSYDDPSPTWRALCDAHEVHHDDAWGVGKLVVELYEALVEHELWEPTFVIDYPVETSPLARRHRDQSPRHRALRADRRRPRARQRLLRADRPDDQRERFEARRARRPPATTRRCRRRALPAGDGARPAADRRARHRRRPAGDAARRRHNIRDVILFPTLRPERYVEAAGEVGRALGGAGHDLVYGGGDLSLMGAVSRGVRDAGGHVTGILPELFADRVQADAERDEVVVTSTMRDRKTAMGDRADAFVVLPGGFGTLEELLEVLVLKMLGYHEDPVVLYDVVLDGVSFWQPLLDWFDRLIEGGFARGGARGSYAVAADTDALLEAIASGGGPVERGAASRA